ncbi:AI-2E family transporter [Saxibacter everestensis]|uniref:AI-2E family transporter n=1 Tax=Saxibacter everestensis TaxID=2909229 RepID=A0ABY8QRR0_9MICO|nr:AI-2E family transporter [Brevibacteriaceae bacterium ZFBP1038]
MADVNKVAEQEADLGVEEDGPRHADQLAKPAAQETDLGIEEDGPRHADQPAKSPALRVKAFRIGLTGTLGVGVGLLIWGAVASLGTVLTYIGVALFLAFGLDPVVSGLERKGLRRSLAVATVFVALILAFTGIIFAILPVLVNQIRTVVTDLPDIVNDIATTPWVENLEQTLNGVVDIDGLVTGAGDFVSDPNNLLSIGGGVLAVGAGIASSVTGVIIVLILTLYFISSLTTIKQAFYKMLPASDVAEFSSVADEITASVGRYVLGQVSLALVNGVLSLIFLSIIKAPMPSLLAFIAFLGSLIPLVGTLSGSIIIVVVCLFASPLTALVAGIYYLVYMQIEAYLLSPRIMNKAVEIPGAIVVIAAIAGGTLGGILGALVAIPVAASILIIIRRVVVPRQALK